MITYIELLENLSYCDKTGIFTWKTSRRKVKPGDVAGTDDRGRIQIRLNGKNYFAHRLAWLYVHGEWPKEVIDHINGNKKDNRMVNLRDVPTGLNSKNMKKSINNKSGYNGVSQIPSGKFIARLRINGKKKSLGLFPTAYEAHLAYEAEKVLHGYTHDHGIR